MGDENQEQLDFMADLLGDAPVVEQAEETATEAISFDSDSEQKLEPEQEVEQEVEVEQPVETEQPEVTEPSVEETLRAQLVAMAAQLEALQSGQSIHQIYPAPDQPAQASTPEGTPAVPATPVPAPTPAQAYLTEEELDQIIDNPALILTAIQRAQVDITNQFASNLPVLVSNLVNQQVAIQSIVTEFYDENKDLRPHADYVKYIMRNIESQHKDKPFQEILQMTADESRKKLGLQNPAQQQRAREQSSQQRPAFAGTRRAGTQRPATKQSEWFDPAAADLLTNL